jgi:hypothetical protein
MIHASHVISLFVEVTMCFIRSVAACYLHPVQAVLRRSMVRAAEKQMHWMLFR